MSFYHPLFLSSVECMNLKTRYVLDLDLEPSPRSMELRCVIAIVRHGDRTPKQKMKMEVRHKR